MLHRRTLIGIAALVCMLFFAVCSYAPQQTYTQPTEHVLTITARRTDTIAIQRAEQRMIETWAQDPEREGQSFRLEFDAYCLRDESDVLARLDLMFMAGQAPDIFFPVPNHRHVLQYAQAGFLVDMYPLIKNDPDVSQDDFITQALTAWETDGRLYVMPWEFRFVHVFMNANLPPEFIERFSQHSSITTAELLAIYSDLVFNHAADFGHFNFSHGATLHYPVQIMAAYMGNYMDFDSRTVNLTAPDFVAFLADLFAVFDRPTLQHDRRYTPQEIERGHGVFTYHHVRMLSRGSRDFDWGTCTFPASAMERIISSPILSNLTMQPNAFIVESRRGFTSSALFEITWAPYFTHGIPLADNYGRLLIGDTTETPAGVSITATADIPVAWEFTRHLLYAYNGPRQNCMAVPIIRDVLYPRLYDSAMSARNGAVSALWRNLAASDPAETARQRKEAVANFAPRANMPMALTYPQIPASLYIDNFDLFMRGLITVDEFANRLQNAVLLWLLES